MSLIHFPLLLANYTRPFLQPLPVWDFWYLFLIPLLLAVGIVYKSVKCSHVSEVPLEAAKMAGWILSAFVTGALALLLFVKFMQ